MKKIISFLLLLLVLFNIPAHCVTVSGIVIYVSTVGDDNGLGDFKSPFKTLERARDEIRTLRKMETKFSGATVLIRGGEYFFDKAFTLEKEDSGTDEFPITYMPYKDEKVSLLGGININPEDISDIKDKNVYNRLDVETWDFVKQVDLKKKGITDIGKLNYPGAYRVPWIPDMPSAPELFFNDEAMHLSRYPNEGFLRIDRIINGGAIPRNWQDDKKNVAEYVKPENRKQDDTFVIECIDDRVKTWKNVDGIKMYGYWFWDWADQTVDLKEIDIDNNTIKSAQPSYYGVKQDARYYFYNILEEIDEAGEYYIDKETNILYFYPPSELDNANIQLTLNDEAIIKLNNCSNIVLTGFDIMLSRGNLVNISGGKNNLISYCYFKNSGKNAVNISGENNGIANSKIFNTNGGVSLSGGLKETLTPANNYVQNCEIEEFARINKTYNGAVALNGVGNRASNNKIHGADHLGIVFNGNDHMIEYNEIFDVLRSTDDAGAIYCGRDWTFRGNVIRYNYIHNIKSDVKGDFMVFGVYLDDAYSSADIYGNVFENIDHGYAIQIGGGRDNLFRNNIVIDCLGSVLSDSRCFDEWFSSQIEGSLKPNLQKVPYQGEIWANRYPNLATILDSDPRIPAGNIIKNNVYVNSEMQRIDPKLREYGTVENNISYTKDPGFISEKNYKLKENSKVFSDIPNFDNIPFEKIGYNHIERQIIDVTQQFKGIVLKLNSENAIAKGDNIVLQESEIPFLQDGKTMVPLRFLAENIGLKVVYDSLHKIIIIVKDSDVITLKVNEKEIFFNGEIRSLSTNIYEKDGKVFVPLRDIGEMLGTEILYDESGIVLVGKNLSDEIIKNLIKN